MKTAITLTISTLVSLAICEGIVRVLFGELFAQRPGFYVHDAQVGWKPEINLDHTFHGDDFRMSIRTNNQGERLGPRGDNPADTEYLILSGDSYTFGWGVDTHETLAAYLEELIDRQTGGGVRVVNLGVGGYGTLQSYYRLQHFVDTHATEKIVAVVHSHVANDMTDNLKSLPYHIGTRKSGSSNHVNRSVFRLVNFINRSIHSRKRHTSAPEGANSQPEDVLWAFSRGQRSEWPETVRILGIEFAGDVITAEDTDEHRTNERASLTDLQRDLLSLGMKRINCAVDGHSTPIFYQSVATTPGWYDEEVVALTASAETCGSTVHNLGRFIEPSSFSDPILNAHSGAHYTPEFNAFWAERLFARLVEADIFDMRH